MSERQLRVAVLSPHQIVFEGLRAMLRSMRGRVQVVRFDAGTPDPDVVLYDAIDFAHGDLTDLNWLVNKTTARVLVVSRDMGPDLAELALASGAYGCFSMSADCGQILAALDSVGLDLWRGEGSERFVVGSGASKKSRDPVGITRALSQRETQILSLIGRGCTNADIAEECHLSPNTVKTYIRTAYRKIGVSSRSQATAWAISHGTTAQGTASWGPRVATPAVSLQP